MTDTNDLPALPALDPAVLNEVITAEEFIRWITPEVYSEANFTEDCNESRRLADYIADLETWLSRLNNGEVEEMESVEEFRAKVSAAPKGDYLTVSGDQPTITIPLVGEDAQVVLFAANGDGTHDSAIIYGG